MTCRTTSWSTLDGPCLVVGSGRGLLTRALNAAGVQPVVGIDRSPAMTRYARKDGNIVLVGEAERLLTSSASFRSVVIATGVLDFAEPGRVAAVRDEAFRVVHPDEMILIAFFAPSRAMQAGLKRFGLMSGVTQHTGRIVTLCFARRGVDGGARPDDLVAYWTGCERSEAEHRLREGFSLLTLWLDRLEAASDQLRSDGDQNPVDTLLQAFDWSLTGWDRTETPPDLRHPYLSSVADTTDEDACMRILLMRKNVRHQRGRIRRPTFSARLHKLGKFEA